MGGGEGWTLTVEGLTSPPAAKMEWSSLPERTGNLQPATFLDSPKWYYMPPRDLMRLEVVLSPSKSHHRSSRRVINVPYALLWGPIAFVLFINLFNYLLNNLSKKWVWGIDKAMPRDSLRRVYTAGSFKTGIVTICNTHARVFLAILIIQERKRSVQNQVHSGELCQFPQCHNFESPRWPRKMVLLSFYETFYCVFSSKLLKVFSKLFPDPRQFYQLPWLPAGFQRQLISCKTLTSFIPRHLKYHVFQYILFCNLKSAL